MEFQQLQLTSVLVKQSGQSGWKTKLSPAASSRSDCHGNESTK
jgi:hypothetical protein